MQFRPDQAYQVCRSLAFHFRPNSGSLPVHLGSIDGHMMCPIIQFFKKIEFRKICGHTDIHTDRYTRTISFYVYIDISKTKLDSSVLVEKILLETGVALTPGKDFDKINGSKSFRLAYSIDGKVAEEGTKKLMQWFLSNY